MSLQIGCRFLGPLVFQLRNIPDAQRIYTASTNILNPWPANRARVSALTNHFSFLSHGDKQQQQQFSNISVDWTQTGCWQKPSDQNHGNVSVKCSQFISPRDKRQQHHHQHHLHQQQQRLRNISSDSAQMEYRLEHTALAVENFQVRVIYKEAVNAVEPRQMVAKVLQFDDRRSVLTVQDKSYSVHCNVYVVGFGKAVLGMARAVEDILGPHVAGGILSIPRGQRDVLKEKDKGDLLLHDDSKILVYEGGKGHLPDSMSLQAALDIERLLLDRTEDDLVIMLISGGGSALLPLPQEGISLDDLSTMTTLMYKSGGTVGDVNTLRKYLERLKGGKAIDAAFPAKVVSLIISDVVGDSVRLIASGPTVHDQVTAHQCLDIVGRLGIMDDLPLAITHHLRTQLAEEQSRVQIQGMGRGVEGLPDRRALRVRQEEQAQNVLVGSNLIACQAAAARARELGHIPYILSTCMTGEARTVGATLATLGTFMLLCFDRRQLNHLSLLTLELDIVRSGVSKQQVNDIISVVETAVNMGRHATIISGGETVVNIKSSGGVGGRNLELVLGASIQLNKLFNLQQVRTHPSITILSADTDGEDGTTPAAGAVVTENFELEARQEGFTCQDFLDRNDSYSVLSTVRGGASLVVTRMTATNVMDIQVMVVRNPLISSHAAISKM